MYICKTKLLLTTALVLALIMFYSCSKIVEIDIPSSDPMLVVEGTIKLGQKPVVLLSLSQGYFDPVNLNVDEFYLSGAQVSVSVDGNSYDLIETHPAALEFEQLKYLSQIFKVSPIYLKYIDFPVYTISRRLPESSQLIGQVGKTYDLHVAYQDYETSASTTMHPTIPLNDSYFLFPEDSQSDSLGIINIVYTDPDTLGNAYRWASRRINQYPEWHELAGQIKDPFYIYPLGSVWDDLIINGGVYDFPVLRFPSENDQLDSLERGLWKLGDTVLMKLETIDLNAYETLLSYETAISAQGNPFAPPSNVISHLDSALGWWIATSDYVDTVICQP